ncbi:MAG: tail fiber domain-containing protein [Lachnospiraceae bacterium]|nr:tail fiber domain-containing protein [Lachnospiraceae bacterium]
MENKINVKIKQCYDTEENYKANNPVLLAGQLAYTKDKYGKYKIGDGVSHWNDLDYTENIFIGTQKEYEEKNIKGEISPGTIVYITDDNDYCNITIDKELSSTSPNLVENQAVTKALEALTYEDVGALPLHGTSDNSLGIINNFKERPASCNIDFSKIQYQNRITYMLATVSMTEGRPEKDGFIINTGWDNGTMGAQLCLGNGMPITAYMRAANQDGTFSDWIEFVTEHNLSSFLQEALMPETAQTGGIMGLPASGTISSILDFKDWFKKTRGGLYTANLDYATNSWEKWINILVLKHKNGNPAYGTADGDKYGLYIYTRMLAVPAGENDKAKDLIWNKMINGEWYGERVILDEKNFTSYTMPRNPEHMNEYNFIIPGNGNTQGNAWFNYRDGKTDGVAATPIEQYIFARGAAVSNSTNYANILAAKATLTNGIEVTSGAIINKGHYYAALEPGTNGTAGWVKFMTIKITGTYVNYPVFVIIGGRQWDNIFLNICFQSVNGTDPGMSSCFRYGGYNDNGITYVKSATSTWDFYMQKNEAYGRIDVKFVSNTYNPYITITFPNTQVTSNPGGTTVPFGGRIYISERMRDAGNGNTIAFNYSTAALAYSGFTYLAVWNGYTLQSVNKNVFMAQVFANSYWGMSVNGATGSGDWVRTTLAGLIPYQSGTRGSGHSALGTSSWYFANAYIDRIYAVALDLTGSIATAITTSTHLNGAKGTNVIINSTAAASGYNILAKMNSNNGVFCIGYYQGAIHLYYITNTKINSNTNGIDKDLTLLNESGNSSFPGTVSANSFSAGGSSALTTLTATNVTVNGNLRLKNSGNYGMKLNFGDGDYVHFYEDTDDHLNIYASKGVEINASSTVTVGHTGGYFIFESLNSSGARFRPTTNGLQSLGKAGYGFNSLYVTHVYSSGTYSGGERLSFEFGSSYIFFKFNNITRCQIQFMETTDNVAISPYGNNKGTIGTANDRWKQFYATNGSISTSDRSEKKEISYLGHESGYDTYMSDETLTKFINGLLACIFKRINGESGRPHHGFIAQDVEKLLKELNIKDHAGFIKSPKTKEVQIEEEYTDENGNTQTRTKMVHEEIHGEYTYGLRYEEFISDLTRYCQILYKKNEELENIQKAQEKKIQELEARFSDMEAKLNKLLNAA